MSKEFMGLVKAHCPGKGKEGKPAYITMGAAFRDTESGNFSLKIDSIPVAGAGWSGWCNIFQETAMDRSGSAPMKSKFTPPDDDIPF